MYVRDFAVNPHGVGDDEGFGIEVEAENWMGISNEHYSQLLTANWNTVEDGSLRNGGIEFISQPMAPRETRRAIRRLYDVGSHYNWTSSIRTSTHVHANVLGFTETQVASVVAAHGIMEPLLFRLAGPLREQNIYCVPWYRAPDEYEFARKLYEGNQHALMDCCKYSSLYLEPMQRFGTIEFRHAPYYERVEDLLQWLDVVERIVYRVPDLWDTPEDVIRAYDDTLGPDEFVSMILGPNLTEVLNQQCEASFSDIIDDVDSITLAESMCPSLCTYKVTDWTVPQLSEPGSTDYRNLRQRLSRRYNLELTSPDMFYDEYPEEDEGYYDEEDY